MQVLNLRAGKGKRGKPSLLLRYFRLNAVRVYPFCAWCGQPLDSSDSSVDHIVPKSRGGQDAIENFALSCKPCNSTKSSHDWGNPPFRPFYLEDELKAASAEYRASSVCRKRRLWRASRMVSLNIPMPNTEAPKQG